LVAAMIARLPAAENFRFGFGGSGGLMFLFGAAYVGAIRKCLTVDLAPPSSICRISAIRASIRVFCISNPSIAAVRVSVVSLVGM
jgi:hypothetical protein